MLPSNHSIEIQIKGNNSESNENFPLKLDLKNNSIFDISIKNAEKKFTIDLIVASDPANQNIMLKVDGVSNTVIKPGGVSHIPLEIDNTRKTCQVKNRLIETIQIHETTDFRIPFKVIPYIRMSTSMQVDLLNTSLFDVQAELQKERKRKGEVGDCDVLTKMLYSTFFPFNDKSKVILLYFFGHSEAR